MHETKTRPIATGVPVRQSVCPSVCHAASLCKNAEWIEVRFEVKTFWGRWGATRRFRQSTNRPVVPDRRKQTGQNSGPGPLMFMQTIYTLTWSRSKLVRYLQPLGWLFLSDSLYSSNRESQRMGRAYTSCQILMSNSCFSADMTADLT